MSTNGPSSSTLSSRRVLLVDGDDDSRAMYAEFLTFDQWRVEEAADGREGLARAIIEQPDIIVCDTHLTGISGYDLCDRLRSNESTRTIPIIVVTADVSPADVQRARTAGAALVLAKPCLPNQLSREAERLIGEFGKLRQPGSRDQALGAATRPARFKSDSKPALSTDLA